MKIAVTDKALDELKRVGLKSYNFLRLGVQPGGCAGMSYTAVFDTGPTDRDKVVFEQDKLRVVADAEFLSLLDGLTIDYSDDLIQPGLILKNPNAEQSCGCGASFKAGNESPCPSCGGCG